MGNRAIITTEKKDLAVYLHWNGGRDSVEAFLDYCKLRGFRAPEKDCYGWARLCQVLSNFFGPDGLSVGIDSYENMAGAGGDNGEYIIRDWEIVDRVFPYEPFSEQNGYDRKEMLHAIDESQPTDDQLGSFLDAVQVRTSMLRIGDEVYMGRIGQTPKLFEVVGFADTFGMKQAPFVNQYLNDGSYESNPNNYIRSEFAWMKPKNI